MTENTVGYSNPLGVYGNQSRMLTFDSKEVIEERRQYNKAALQKREEMQIFYFNPREVEIENAAVEKVIAEYVPILESGSVDTQRYYRQFLKELELAGIDNIIQEKQRQYDQWKRMN